MKSIANVGLQEVQAVYDGVEGDLWELFMGQQIHIGGMTSSMDLASRAGIGAGMRGVDLCCCNGAGMRVLVRFCNVDSMTGVDATETVVERGRQRCKAEGLDAKIRFVLGDVCDSKLPEASADFVWGEDAWCYVTDKPRLIAEAVRVVKPGGAIAFTDWVEGPAGLSTAEADRFLGFMKFATVEDIPGYARLLEKSGCTVVSADDTQRFAPYVDLYMSMVNMQLTYDALRIIGFDTDVMNAVAGEFAFLQQMAHEGKIAQGRFVARRN